MWSVAHWQRLVALCAILVAALPCAAHAQGAADVVTLAQARQRARAMSPNLAAARAAASSAAGRERQSGAFPNPALTWSREQTSYAGAANSQDMVVLEQRLEIGGQPSRRAAAARWRRLAAEAELAAAQASLDAAVATAYAAALAGDRRATLARSAAAHFEQASRVMAERLAAGDASGYALRRIRLEAARYAALAALAQLEARASRLQLATLVSIPPESPLQPLVRTSDLATLLAMPADSIEALATQNHAGLRAARLIADAAAADARVASAERVPVPLASVGFKDERLLDGAGASGFVVGLSFPIPLWDRRSGSIDAARAESERLALEAESARLRVRSELLTAIEAARQTDARAALLEAELGAEAQAALQAAETAFAEGEITLLEWLDAVRAYQEAEAAFAAVVAESVTHRASLERLLGVTLIR